MADDKNGLIALFVALFAMIIALASIVNTFSGNYSDLTDKPIIDKYIDLQHGLVLWLPFDGSDLDKSGFRFDGSSAGVSYLVGKYGRCAYFDGSSYDAVAGVDLQQYSNRTYNFWVYGLGGVSTTYERVFSDETSTNVGVMFVRRPSSDLLYFGCYDGSVKAIQSTGGFPEDVWLMVTVTIDSGSVARLYVNTVQVGSDRAVGDLSGYGGSGLDVGKSARSATDYFNGYVDDFRVYNRVLSGYEIEQLYNLGV